MAEPAFTLEQIRHQAQEDALAFLLACVVYFKEQGSSPQQFIAAVGNTLAPGWINLKGHGPRVVMDVLALHIVSLGGRLVAMAGDDDLTYATFSHLPSSDTLKSFGLNRRDADAIWDLYKPIIASLKLWYEWSRERDEVTFKLSRTNLAEV